MDMADIVKLIKANTVTNDPNATVLHQNLTFGELQAVEAAPTDTAQKPAEKETDNTKIMCVQRPCPNVASCTSPFSK